MGRLTPFTSTRMIRGTGGGEIVLGPLVITAYTGIRETDAQGRIRFLSDGILTVENDTLIDAFLVGGGASGASAGDEYFMNGSPGGGGGYTKTAKKLLLRAGIRYPITIGAGGVHDDGGRTNAFGVNADGGRMHRYPSPGNTEGASADGGSGGGGMDGNGGADGGDGTGGNAGTGQGSTTRAFGEEDGELFSGGGSGGASLNQKFPIGGAGGGGNADPDGVTSGGENTGGGGAGGSWYDKMTETENGMITVEQATTEPGAGGSGIVIIREAV